MNEICDSGRVGLFFKMREDPGEDREAKGWSMTENESNLKNLMRLDLKQVLASRMHPGVRTSCAGKLRGTRRETML